MKEIIIIQVYAYEKLMEKYVQLEVLGFINVIN